MTTEIPNTPEARFLEEKTAELDRQTKNTWSVGIVVAVVLIGYFSFILTMVKTFTDPAKMSAFLVAEVEAGFPEFLGDVEYSLQRQANAVANDMSRYFIATVKEMRPAAERQLDYCYAEMIPHVSQELSTVVATYIRDHHADLETLAEAELADQFTREMMAELGPLMEAELAASSDGNGFDYFRDNSLLAMETMDDFLNDLVQRESGDLNRRELLQRRILAAVTLRLIKEG